MLQLDNVTLRRGPDITFQHVSLTLNPGWKAGLTGRNGSGKSSLLALLTGELDTDAGSVRIPPDWRVAVMAQEVPALARSALDYVLDGHSHLRNLEAELSNAEQSNKGDAIAAAHAGLENIRAWELPSRAASLLAGLGVTQAQHQQPVADFSGGWRMRLNLARVLMTDADLLLLDEPTNHLDLDAILWLEDWLKQVPATVIVISHDRDFLDAVVSHILHIEQQSLTQYSGNYSAFERQRAQRLAVQESEYRKQQAQAEHLNRFITRFKAKATKARQAQSRIKALEKLTMTAPAHVSDGFSFSFLPPARLTDPMIRLESAICGYDKTPVLNDVNLIIRPETRLGLLGRNGAGKSTLIKSLSGQLPLLQGQCELGPDLIIGYFHQQQVDALPEDSSPHDLMQKTQPSWEESRVRSELGRFGFQGDDVFDPIKRFSGGEKSRLALALLIQQQPALLLLDEPANHLDLDMREALTLALQAFTGAVVLVSHDRHLLETTVDQLILVAHGDVKPWEGDLDDYARWLREQLKSSHNEQPTEVDKPDARQKRQQAAEKRNRLRPLKQQMEKQEKILTICQKKLHEIEIQLADEKLYQTENKSRLTDLLAQQTDLRRQQQQQEEIMLESMEALEIAEQAMADSDRTAD